ncbi:MAG: AAA family ATPase [Rubrivivax sp.]
MRIRELKLIRYGKFTSRHLDLPHSTQDIHFIVGPNEAGKSTVRQAISDWLFGIPARTSLAFLHPMPEMRLGGVLEAADAPGEPGRELAFDRTKGNKSTLRTPTDAALPDNVLQPWLGNLQAHAFNRMYALDHSTLLEGSEGMLSAQDDLGRLLFQSAAGIEHLGDALKQLESEADSLWAPRTSGSRAYYKALEDYEAAHARFKQATLRSKDWSTQHDDLKKIEQKLDDARKRDADLRVQISRLERIRRVAPLLQGLDAAQQHRAALLSQGDVPLLAPDAAASYAVALRDLTLAKADTARLEQEIAQLKLEAEGQHVATSSRAMSSADCSRSSGSRRCANAFAEAVKPSRSACIASMRLRRMSLMRSSNPSTLSMTSTSAST